MSWDKTLLPASFRDVTFEVISTDDPIERSVIKNEYPYVDGANTEDMGRLGREINMLAVFYGDDYETRLQVFLQALGVPGSGTLVHPIFGVFNAQFVRAGVPHHATEPDQTRVPLLFFEDNLRTPLFSRVLPIQSVQAINEAADKALAAARAGYQVDIKKSNSLTALLRAKLSADMLGAIDKMSEYTGQLIEARGWVASGMYYLDNPVAFVDDVAGGLVSRVTALYSSLDIRAGYSGSSSGSGYTRGSLATVWQAPLMNLQQPFFSSTDTVQPFLVTHMQVQQSIAIAAAAAQLYDADLAATVLTPTDIENVAADVRTALQAALDAARATYPDIVRSRPITEPLKDVALAVAEAAEKLIRAKPPLRERVVDTPGNLQLLAHFWYGDYRRADELLRLNPQVRNPNFIAGGTALRAYAV